MTKMYDINADMQALDGLLDTYAEENLGDISDFPFNDELDRLKGKRKEKLLNLAVWHKDLKSQAEVYAKEIKRLQADYKALNNKSDSIKEYIDYNLEKGEKLSDTRAVLSYRESSQVIIDVLTEDLPDAVVKISFTPDKVAIKEAIKKGDCHYAHMQICQNLNIK